MPHDEIKLALYQSLATLADTIALREAQAMDHQRNVSQVSRAIAQIMRMDEDEIEAIRIAATLHDVGFILLPSGILTKPGELTDEERAVVRQHPIHSAEIIKNIEFPWDIAEIVLQHHERLDGSGYPQGLKGDDILLEARVIAVADVMESMLSPRPWRDALSLESALAEIQNFSGVKYDAYVVEAAVELYTKQRYRLDPEYYGRN
ncbi:MAG TPA: HD domain-containing phosphohydrolase [Patescibacteria group bacterium]|nr:HD domain-containing phosphohydrolase [Patescibacteria group bacterium]